MIYYQGKPCIQLNQETDQSGEGLTIRFGFHDSRFGECILAWESAEKELRSRASGGA